MRQTHIKYKDTIVHIASRLNISSDDQTIHHALVDTKEKERTNVCHNLN